MTKKGMFRYKRLMFGICCAPEIFQKILEQVLCGCEGCINYIDDILIFGENREQLEERTRKVLNRLKDNDITLNNNKCRYGETQVQFLGHVLSAQTIRPVKDKLESIKLFRNPENADEIRSFLGLVNYIGRFIPNLATLSEPLRQLTKKSVKFEWTAQQQNSFKAIKDHMSNDLVLGYYDVKDKTQLYTDASPVGLGAVLVQINERGPRIIAFGNKSLSDTEKRYCQTEKEALGLVWGVEHFHFHLYGRIFELITDHKPLEVIFGPQSKPCARIERWVLRLQSYKFKVIYQPGKSNIADTLSRLVVNTNMEPVNSFDETTEAEINQIAALAAPVAIRLSEIEKQSEDNSDFNEIKNALDTNKWPEHLVPYKPFANELCFTDKILLRGHRIIMPSNLRERTLSLAHEGHPGMTIMKRRLRSKVWWPKIDTEVEKLVSKCKGCILASIQSAPEPLKTTPLPSKPWQHLAVDYLGPLPSGHNLLVLVDYYSRYIEIDIMKKIDSTQTIRRLNTIFARFGIPITLTADNGPQFASEEFKKFCESNNIKLISTTPYWPQQNGEVERQNRSILKRIVISQNTGGNWMDDLQQYLLMYRSTPHSTTLKTPSELLFGFNIRDKLPNMEQPFQQDEEAADRDKEKKEKSKEYTDKKRNAVESNIEKGDEVLVKKAAKTNKLTPNFDPEPMTVIERKGAEAVVQSEETGKTYRRNVAHLKRTHNKPKRFDEFLM